MIEILGGDLDLAIKELNVKAVKTATVTKKIKKYQVWELDENNFEILCDVDENEWKDNWGWWRSANGAVISPIEKCTINGIEVFGYHNEALAELNEELQKEEAEEDWSYPYQIYTDLFEHFSEARGASQPRNVTALAIEMAKANNMKLSELMIKLNS